MYLHPRPGQEAISIHLTAKHRAQMLGGSCCLSDTPPCCKDQAALQATCRVAVGLPHLLVLHGTRSQLIGGRILLCTGVPAHWCPDPCILSYEDPSTMTAFARKILSSDQMMVSPTCSRVVAKAIFLYKIHIGFHFLPIDVFKDRCIILWGGMASGKAS